MKNTLSKVAVISHGVLAALLAYMRTAHFIVQMPTRIPETLIPEFTTIPEKSPTTELFI